MKLNEVLAVNVKRIALDIQTKLLDRLEGFESELETIEADGKLISAKLYIQPAPWEFVKSFYKTAAEAKRLSCTGKRHAIEVYNGPEVALDSSFTSINRTASNKIVPGVYLLDSVKRGKSQLNIHAQQPLSQLNNPDITDEILPDLVSYVSGLTPDIVEMFTDSYITNWGQ